MNAKYEKSVGNNIRKIREEAKKLNVLVEVITTIENHEGLLVSEAAMKKISNTVHPVKVLGIPEKDEDIGISTITPLKTPISMPDVLRPVSWDDLDFNHHMNNARYLDIVFNMVDFVAKKVEIAFEFLKFRRLDIFRIGPLLR